MTFTKWDMVYVVCRRGFSKEAKGDLSHQAGPWTIEWFQTANLESHIWPGSMITLLKKLGDQGFHPVGISPVSSFLGAGGMDPKGIDYAGFTSEMYWIFEKPQSK